MAESQAHGEVRDSPGTETLASRVMRAMAGDAGVFGDLAAEAWPELVRLARIALAGSSECEDVAQSALLIAWRRRAELRVASSFQLWLRRIVWREALRIARRNRRETPCRGLDSAVHESNPTARLEAARLLAVLSPRQRAVFFLSEVEGRTAEEIGRELGLAAATVRVHRWQAIRRLHRLKENR